MGRARSHQAHRTVTSRHMLLLAALCLLQLTRTSIGYLLGLLTNPVQRPPGWTTSRVFGMTLLHFLSLAALLALTIRIGLLRGWAQAVGYLIGSYVLGFVLEFATRMAAIRGFRTSPLSAFGAIAMIGLVSVPGATAIAWRLALLRHMSAVSGRSAWGRSGP